MLVPCFRVNWSDQTGDSRVIIDILGIRELKWTEMDKINSNDHYIYYHEEESLIRNGVALTVNKRVQNTVFGG